MLVGICGFAGAGKDTVGKILTDDHGFTRLAFADRVKELALRLDPWLPWGEPLGADYYCDSFDKLSTLLEIYNWHEAKKIPSVRQFLQAIGEGVRVVVGSESWIQASGVYDTDDSADVVITDVRYPNELAAIRGLGGYVWWVDRPGVGPVNDHSSENSISPDDADLVIGNDTDLRGLTNSVVHAMIQTEILFQ